MFLSKAVQLSNHQLVNRLYGHAVQLVGIGVFIGVVLGMAIHHEPASVVSDSGAQVAWGAICGMLAVLGVIGYQVVGTCRELARRL